MLRKNLEGRVRPWEEAGPGRCWHVKDDDATGAASFVLQRKLFLDLDLESDGFMDRDTKETRGAPKRRRYTIGSKPMLSTSCASSRTTPRTSGRRRSAHLFST
ncbi:unnamed protein product [Ectocarpus sp. CCAP 1310/34]|nr:unnamed protein product [Ectocarpus sp. CCAP 1310/34]